MTREGYKIYLTRTFEASAKRAKTKTFIGHLFWGLDLIPSLFHQHSQGI